MVCSVGFVRNAVGLWDEFVAVPLRSCVNNDVHWSGKSFHYGFLFYIDTVTQGEMMYLRIEIYYHIITLIVVEHEFYQNVTVM